ncbi:MAG: phosphatidylinositol-specific phospholipase C domain-containing protein [Faecalibacterium sp.]|nr:phosphatidylinositol-specific phospholipase C domain-containing protein [Ruminococcus sp.]MCM1391463.1 phosphatidylinositol-specific phospholipase C domain-containing protein [Ruminococcus sp.]MCM1485279.1 phosphatidylinositol-specific phospholipase C domain-containing protein [Faecalibacterium sp.]
MSIKKILSVLLTVLLICSLTITAFAADQQVGGANWMSTVDGNKKITSINIPGTHDSATRNNSIALISTTQNLSIMQQLNAGVRYLDIRAKKTNNNYISVHGISNNKTSYGVLSQNLTIGDIIKECKDFLYNNPGETILFKLKEDSGNAKEAFYTDFYKKYIADDKDAWFTENRIPTLDEVRGKIVLLRHASLDYTLFNDTNSGIDFGDYPYIEEKEVGNFKTEYMATSCFYEIIDAFEDVDEFIEVDDEWYHAMKMPFSFGKMLVEDAYQLSPKKKIQAIEMFLDGEYENDDTCFNICNTNSSDSSYPEKNAVIINEFLSDYEFVADKKYGVMCMDFVTHELAEKVYMTNIGSMINEPNKPVEVGSFYAGFGLWGEQIKKINDFILRICLLFK